MAKCKTEASTLWRPKTKSTDSTPHRQNPAGPVWIQVTALTSALSPVCLCPDSTDRPLFLFSLPDIHNTTTLLLSDDGSTLYVGARNAILSLDVSQSDVINLKKKVSYSRFTLTPMMLWFIDGELICSVLFIPDAFRLSSVSMLSLVQVVWSPSDTEINECRLKGKNPTVILSTSASSLIYSMILSLCLVCNAKLNVVVVVLQMNLSVQLLVRPRLQSECFYLLWMTRSWKAAVTSSSCCFPDPSPAALSLSL